MAYQYYQQNIPGWGTSQFAFGAPPPLAYVPASSWNGLDYYRAHVMASGAQYDPAFYQNVVNRAMVGGAGGSGLYEAEHWHRRAYGGLGELTRMLPAEIGAAAAFEAWRQFRHNMLQYDYLSPFDARRDALFGIAVAEAVRLWQDTGRGFDQFGSQAAAEAATATVSIILNQVGNDVGMAGSYAGGLDPYYHSRRSSGRAYDDDDIYSRGRSLSRSPMYSPSYAGSTILSPMAGTSTIGMPYSYTGGTMPYSYYGSAYGGAYPYTMGGYQNTYGSTYPYMTPGTATYAAGYTAPYAYTTTPSVVTIGGSGHHHHRGRSHRRHHSTGGYGYTYAY